VQIGEIRRDRRGFIQRIPTELKYARMGIYLGIKTSATLIVIGRVAYARENAIPCGTFCRSALPVSSLRRVIFAPRHLCAASSLRREDEGKPFGSWSLKLHDQ
jgi:hypothetical protein